MSLWNTSTFWSFLIIFFCFFAQGPGICSVVIRGCSVVALGVMIVEMIVAWRFDGIDGGNFPVTNQNSTARPVQLQYLQVSPVFITDNLPKLISHWIHWQSIGSIRSISSISEHIDDSILSISNFTTDFDHVFHRSLKTPGVQNWSLVCSRSSPSPSRRKKP